eukprot:gnl/Trimastix_PCT/2583.p1 GENE.gnl/Trimastix_PCT/2583~~gnl/Trimastix_PCT/2583.p1  ORF type:complete len:183 (+),score=22.87 gnl/Trimastix_PCT/2583:43-591(+)
MRLLRYHEQKLLKKVNFLQWKKEGNLREVRVLRRYHIQDREDYRKYNKLCGHITSLVSQLKKLPEEDSIRIELAQKLLDKLYNLGVLKKANNLGQIDKLSASKFCKRRLPVVMVLLQMAPTVQQAVKFVEQGHVRVGPEVITDPAFLVTRKFEDFVTWTDRSAIRRSIEEYKGERDDYDLMN